MARRFVPITVEEFVPIAEEFDGWPRCCVLAWWNGDNMENHRRDQHEGRGGA